MAAPSRRTAGREPRTVVTLRDPAERVEIGSGRNWVDLGEGERLLTFFGPPVDDRRDVRSVPWSRVVSIDSQCLPMPRSRDDEHRES